MEFKPRIWSLWIFILLVIFSSGATSNGHSTWSSEECIPSTKTEQIQQVGNNADIYISCLLDVHGSSRQGIYGCGPVSERGVVIFEAMKWLLSIINLNSGTLNGYQITESLIPGIKVGIIVFDTCNNKELGNYYLTKMYPVLEHGSDDCEANGPIYQNAFSAIDMTGTSTDPKVSSLSRHYHLPIISLNLDSFLPPETVAKALSNVMTEFKWQQIAIIHTSDEHSLQVIKLLGQASLSRSLCLKYVQSLPALKEDSDDMYSKSNSVAFIAILRNVLLALDEDVPILIIGNGRPVHRLLETMSERLDVVTKHQWLFSSLPEPKSLEPFLNSSANIFTLSSYPGSIGDFEGYWEYLHRHGINQSFAWFDELIKEKATQGVGTKFGDYQLDTLWRTNNIMPLIQTVFVLVHAFRVAWANRCHEEPGLCHELAKMTRKDFETNFLGDIHFEDRSLREMIRSRISQRKGPLNNVEEIELALNKLVFSDPRGIRYQNILGFYSESGNVHVFNKNHSYKSSICPSSRCDKCLKIRQSRIADNQVGDQDQSASSSSFVRLGDDEMTLEKKEQCLAKCSDALRSGSVLDVEESASKTTAEETWNQKLEYIHVSGGWYLTMAIVSALGIILIIVCGFYFHLVFPITLRSCLLEYIILLGVIIIFSINFVYLLPTSFIVCTIRRLGMSTGYTMVLSALFAKVLNVRRLTALRNKGVEKLKSFIPSSLLLIAYFLISLQFILTVIWLFIIPPKPNFRSNTCAWPHTDAFIQTESIVSLVYNVILVGLTILLSIASWTSPDNHHEPRWIAVACLLVSSVWCSWALGISYSAHFRYHSNMTTVCANIISAILVTLCLYLRKLRVYLKVPLKAHKGRSPSQLGLHNSSFSGSCYGTLPKNPKFALFNGHNSYFRHNNSENKRSTLSTSFFLPWTSVYKNDDDGQSSCASTSGSIQVQAEDLYPMEVFEDGDSMQQYQYYTPH